MVPGLLERERLGAEMRHRQMLATAERERLVDAAVVGRRRAAVPGWRRSLGASLVRLGGLVQGTGWATGAPAAPLTDAAVGR